MCYFAINTTRSTFTKVANYPGTKLVVVAYKLRNKKEKFTAVRSRSPQNLECGHFTLLFCRGRQRNVRKCKAHVQSDCFCSINLLFCGVVVAVAVGVALALYYGFKTLVDACVIVDRLLPFLQTPENVMHGPLAIDFSSCDLIPTEL